MSNEERGLYITLLCRQWTQGHVTPDEVTRLGSTVVQPSLNHVLTKFQPDEVGNLKNARLELERSKQNAFRALQSEKGKASAKARFNRGSTVVQPSGAPKVNSPSPSPSPNSPFTEPAPASQARKAKEEKQTDPRHKPFITAFCNAYETAFAAKLQLGPKDFAQLSKLLKTFPELQEDEWSGAIDWCYQTARADQYAKGVVHNTGNLAAFCTSWSSLVAYHQIYQPKK